MQRSLELAVLRDDELERVKAALFTRLRNVAQEPLTQMDAHQLGLRLVEVLAEEGMRLAEAFDGPTARV